MSKPKFNYQDNTIKKIAELTVWAYENNTYMKDACSEILYHYPEIDQDILVYMWMAIDAWVDSHPDIED